MLRVRSIIPPGVVDLITFGALLSSTRYVSCLYGFGRLKAIGLPPSPGQRPSARCSIPIPARPKQTLVLL
jgi:hypothetical protein